MALPEARGDFIWMAVGSPWELLVTWLLIINLAAFLMFGWDKRQAKYKQTHEHARRVPEKHLFALALLGGGAGAFLGMRIWRHKTLHKRFCLGIPAILIVQLLLLAGLWLLRNTI